VSPGRGHKLDALQLGLAIPTYGPAMLPTPKRSAVRSLNLVRSVLPPTRRALTGRMRSNSQRRISATAQATPCLCVLGSSACHATGAIMTVSTLRRLERLASTLRGQTSQVTGTASPAAYQSADQQRGRGEDPEKTQGPVLQVRELSVRFRTTAGDVPAVDNVTFDLERGGMLGIIGESGSGKTLTALSIARLVPRPGVISAAKISLSGRDLVSLSADEMRVTRGRQIGFVFQDPINSLNPVLTIGEQVAERARRHLGLSRRAARNRAVAFLDRVGIPEPSKRFDDYPHQFSGGMRQRVVIAIALVCEPSLLIADEPTTALDVTIQAQILDLIRSLCAEFGMATILITHDLSIAAGVCDRIIVMYAGQIVEAGAAGDIFKSPQMPYTQGLLDCVPRNRADTPARFSTIEGAPPDIADPRAGCRFVPRCRFRREICHHDTPQLTPRTIDRLARCWGTEAGGWIK
jgi:oligopeptide transport system ATP-binding protein